MKRSVTFALVPVPKPRQTRRDVWLSPPRPAVARYRAFADRMREIAQANRFDFPEAGASILFAMPMPPSWSKKKRAQMHGEPHRQKPDLDNLTKATLDALCEEDCTVWRLGSLTKYWADQGSITIAQEAA